jgi:hypothetical protein
MSNIRLSYSYVLGSKAVEPKFVIPLKVNLSSNMDPAEIRLIR